MQLKIVQRHNFNFWNFSCHKIKKKKKKKLISGLQNQSAINMKLSAILEETNDQKKKGCILG